MLIWFQAFVHLSAQAQSCSDCTIQVNSTDVNNYTLNTGETLCISATGTVKGSIQMNGGTICNEGRLIPAELILNEGKIINHGELKYNGSLALANDFLIENYSRVEVKGNLFIDPFAQYIELDQNAFIITNRSGNLSSFQVYWERLNALSYANDELTRVGFSNWCNSGVSINKIPFNKDGWIEYTVANTGSLQNKYIGFVTHDTLQYGINQQNDIYYGVYISDNKLYSFGSGAGPLNQLNVTLAAGDKIQLHRSNYTFLIKLNGAIVHTMPYGSAAELRIKVSIENVNTSINNLRCSEEAEYTTVPAMQIFTDYVSGQGAMDGFANLTLSSGTLPYTYSWQPGAITTEDITDRAAGIYTISVNDMNTQVRQEVAIGYQVGWQRMSANLSTEDGELMASANSNWASSAFSVNKLDAASNGWIEYTVDNTGTGSGKIIGFINNETKTSGDLQYEDLYYGFYVDGQRLLTYTQNNGMGIPLHYLKTGDNIRIERIGASYFLKINGYVLDKLANGSTAAMYVKAAMNNSGTVIKGLRASFTGLPAFNAQCNLSITGRDNGNYTLNAGDTLCVGDTAYFNGTLVMNGGVLYNSGLINVSALTIGDNSVIYNKGILVVNDADLNLPATTKFYNYPGASIYTKGNINIANGAVYINYGKQSPGGWVTPIPVIIFLPASVTVCSGQPYKFNPKVLFAGNNPTYFWTPATGLNNASILLPTLLNPQTTITYQFAVSGPFNSVVKSIMVVVNPSPQVSVTSPISICTNTPVVINASATNTTGMTFYNWSPATGLSSPFVLKPTLNVTAPATYTLTVTNYFKKSTCAASATLQVNVKPSPLANAGNDAGINPGAAVTIGGSPAATGGALPYTYSWAPATGLSASNIANPNASPSIPTNYTLTVTGSNGCKGKDEVMVDLSLANPAYAKLDRTLNGNYIQLLDYNLCFVYNEEYKSGNLNYKIYDGKRVLKANAVVLPKQFGDNRYKLNLLQCGFSSSDIGKLFVLEVKSEKNETYLLKFKYK